MAAPIKPHADTIKPKDVETERRIARGEEEKFEEIELVETAKEVTKAEILMEAEPKYAKRETRKAILKLQSAPSFDPLTIP